MSKESNNIEIVWLCILLVAFIPFAAFIGLLLHKIGHVSTKYTILIVLIIFIIFIYSSVKH